MASVLGGTPNHILLKYKVGIPSTDNSKAIPCKCGICVRMGWFLRGLKIDITTFTKPKKSQFILNHWNYSKYPHARFSPDPYSHHMSTYFSQLVDENLSKCSQCHFLGSHIYALLTYFYFHCDELLNNYNSSLTCSLPIPNILDYRKWVRPFQRWTFLNRHGQAYFPKGESPRFLDG